MQVIQGMVEQLLKNMQIMSEQMSQMARKVEPLEINKLNHTNSNIENIRGKGKETNYNKGTFPTQPPINPHNVGFLDSDENFPFDKNKDKKHIDNKSSGKGAKLSDYQHPISFPKALKSSRPLVQSNKLIEALK